MENWKSKLDLKDLWEKYENDEISVLEVSMSLSERLLKIDLSNYNKDDRYYIKDRLFDFSCNFEDIDEIEIFDYELSCLYDFADDNRIWISTLI